MNSFSLQNDKYLFLDMNSFFTSCEQQLSPNLQGKPIVVAPYTGDSGCCIAVSYEAKALGVKTGLGVGETKKLCPEVKIIEARPIVYRQFHHKLVSILCDFTPNLIVKSVDEMTFPLDRYERGLQKPHKLAKKIKAEVALKLGKCMTCSIGVGPNIFWAKQAAEEVKPDGLTVIRLKDIPDFLGKWQLTDIKGIKNNMEKILNRVGIFSPLDIYRSDREILRKKLKVTGEYWWLRLHGYDIDATATKRGSVGHSCVLPPEVRNFLAAKRVLRKLVERAGERLRAEKLTGRGLMLSIKCLSGVKWHKYLKTDSFCDGQTFWKYTEFLWQTMLKNSSLSDQKPIFIAVIAVNVTRIAGEQLGLFSPINKPKLIFEALDLINTRFGKWTLKPASLVGIDEYAPSRIPFGNTQL